MIWPKVEMDPLSGTMRVAVPVLWMFPVSQESIGPATENANEVPTQSNP